MVNFRCNYKLVINLLDDEFKYQLMPPLSAGVGMGPREH